MDLPKEGRPVEELVNAITHGLGAALAAAGLIFLVVSAYVYGGLWHVVSFSIYGASLVLLYLASTLYHSFQNEKRKHRLRIFDHAAIYLLIAGTYTPFALVVLHGLLGWTIFSIVWGLAAVGIVFQLFFVNRFKKTATLCYLFMGWLIVFFLQPLAAALAPEGMFWLAFGGVLYTVGAVFYLFKRIPYNHAVWHVFVMGGSAAHFVAVAQYVLPVAVAP